MPPSVPEGFGQLTFVFQHPAVPKNVVTTLGIRLDGWTDTLTEAANDAHETFVEHLLPDMDSECSLVWVDLYANIGGNSGSVRSTEPAANGGSNRVGEPANIALLITKETATLGRKGRGRMWMPFALGDSNVDEGGNVQTEVRVAWEQNLIDFLADLRAEGAQGDGTLIPVLISQAQGAGNAPKDITGFNVSQKIGTRRSRIR